MHLFLLHRIPDALIPSLPIPMPPSPAKKLLLRIAKVLVAAAVGFLIVAVVLLLKYQHLLIYPARAYAANFRADGPKNMADIAYTTEQGKQLSFYIPPANPGKPKRLWVCFNGNASVAMDWLDYTENYPDPDAGFLLVDYPGYGINPGNPSRAAIQKSAAAALAQLEKELGMTQDEVNADLNVLGFSLGAAVSLEFATRHPVRKVVLLAPFTCMLDMAALTVGRPLNQLLLHRFDNAARLDELAKLSNPPRVFMFHGDRDQVIPYTMSEGLAAAHPQFVTWTKVTGADHGFLPYAARPKVWQVMLPAADGDTTQTEKQSSDANPARAN